MMQVQILGGLYLPTMTPAGGVIDLDDETGAALCRAGLARPMQPAADAPASASEQLGKKTAPKTRKKRGVSNGR